MKGDVLFYTSDTSVIKTYVGIYFVVLNIGVLQYNSPESQFLNPNESIMMSVNISEDYQELYVTISLAWYHNSTKMFPNDRFITTNNGTSLTITDTRESDAGKYEVRIDSIQFSYVDSALCDENLLPILEHLALHAPITFLLRQHVLPTYSREDIIIPYTLPLFEGHYQQSIIINNTMMLNTSAILRYDNTQSWLQKDWTLFTSDAYNHKLTYLDNMTTSTIEISYNNSKELIGDYFHVTALDFYSIDESVCPGYFNYIIINVTFCCLPYFYNYWTVGLLCKLLDFWYDNCHTVYTFNEILFQGGTYE